MQTTLCANAEVAAMSLEPELQVITDCQDVGFGKTENFSKQLSVMDE